MVVMKTLKQSFFFRITNKVSSGGGRITFFFDEKDNVLLGQFVTTTLYKGQFVSSLTFQSNFRRQNTSKFFSIWVI